ncbi:unnamed protein product [Closterium sp. NIES-64]|nr:unnamed protein product [Closterium sp. NIES-64]
MELIRRTLLPFVVALITMARLASAYQVGDYVPLARKGQFNNMRTHWHDAIGRHCPRFGINREVALPIPRPVGFEMAEHSYKMSLSVGNEKFVTPWLLVIGRKSQNVPLIEVTLTHFAGDLRGVQAKVHNLPHELVVGHVSSGGACEYEWGMCGGASSASPRCCSYVSPLCLSSLLLLCVPPLPLLAAAPTCPPSASPRCCSYVSPLCLSSLLLLRVPPLPLLAAAPTCPPSASPRCFSYVSPLCLSSLLLLRVPPLPLLAAAPTCPPSATPRCCSYVSPLCLSSLLPSSPLLPAPHPLRLNLSVSFRLPSLRLELKYARWTSQQVSSCSLPASHPLPPLIPLLTPCPSSSPPCLSSLPLILSSLPLLPAPHPLLPASPPCPSSSPPCPSSSPPCPSSSPPCLSSLPLILSSLPLLPAPHPLLPASPPCPSSSPPCLSSCLSSLPLLPASPPCLSSLPLLPASPPCLSYLPLIPSPPLPLSLTYLCLIPLPRRNEYAEVDVTAGLLVLFASSKHVLSYCPSSPASPPLPLLHCLSSTASPPLPLLHCLSFPACHACLLTSSRTAPCEQMAESAAVVAVVILFPTRTSPSLPPFSPQACGGVNGGAMRYGRERCCTAGQGGAMFMNEQMAESAAAVPGGGEVAKVD